MRPKPKRARDDLLKALEALQDPVAFCKQRGEQVDNSGQAYAFAAGHAKACIEFALQALGEPINPFRLGDAPYHRCSKGKGND